jgi:hypothetical protein
MIERPFPAVGQVVGTVPDRAYVCSLESVRRLVRLVSASYQPVADAADVDDPSPADGAGVWRRRLAGRSSVRVEPGAW